VSPDGFRSEDFVIEVGSGLGWTLPLSGFPDRVQSHRSRLGPQCCRDAHVLADRTGLADLASEQSGDDCLSQLARLPAPGLSESRSTYSRRWVYSARLCGLCAPESQLATAGDLRSGSRPQPIALLSRTLGPDVGPPDLPIIQARTAARCRIRVKSSRDVTQAGEDGAQHGR